MTCHPPADVRNAAYSACGIAIRRYDWLSSQVVEKFTPLMCQIPLLFCG